MTQQPFKIIDNSEKQLPCNIEAEQAVIGSVLISNEILDDISSIISEINFYDPLHQRIYSAINNLPSTTVAPPSSPPAHLCPSFGLAFLTCTFSSSVVV